MKELIEYLRRQAVRDELRLGIPLAGVLVPCEKLRAWADHLSAVEQVPIGTTDLLLKFLEFRNADYVPNTLFDRAEALTNRASHLNP